MTLKEFKRYVDLHGGDLDRWPAPAGVEATILLDESEEARTLLAEAAALDALLDRAVPRVSDAAVERAMGRIAARIDAAASADASPWRLAPAPLSFWPTASFLAVMGLVGFLVTSTGLLPVQDAYAAGLPEILVMNGYLGVAQ